MKLTNLKITPKLGILVGVTLLGLCVAGVLAGYLMQREMLNARHRADQGDRRHGAQHGARPAEAGRGGPDDQGRGDCRVQQARQYADLRQRQRLRVRLHHGWHRRAGAGSQRRSARTAWTSTPAAGSSCASCATALPRTAQVMLRYEFRKPGQRRTDPQVFLRGADPRLEHVRRHRRLSRRSRRQDEADRAGCSGSPFSASRWLQAASPG